MNPIQLTDEHKSKLLEMCEALFPEQSPFHLGLRGEIRKGWGYSRNFLFGKVFSEDGIIIHWFEFCMTYLCEKILNPNPDKPARNLADKFKMFFWETNLYWSNAHLNVNPLDSRHPIDYLYEEFKKLK